MKHKLRLVALLCLMVTSFGISHGIDIRTQKTNFEDYMPLLELAGYNVYSFDIKSMNDRQYKLSFSCREYERDSLINRNVMFYPATSANMTLLSEFSQEDQATIPPENLYDSSRGIYSCAEKIVIGTFSRNDSTTTMMIDLVNESTFSINLTLKPVHNPSAKDNMYSYSPRPFKIGKIELGEFIPLVFYGSAWYDKTYNLFRFCGENELSPDMSSMLIKDVPHSYVIGVTITEITKSNP